MVVTGTLVKQTSTQGCFPLTQLSCKISLPAVQLRDPGLKDLVAICKQYRADDRFTALETTCAAVSSSFL